MFRNSKEEIMKNVYIVSAKRTPIGSFLGSLQGVSASKLGESVVREILKETSIDTTKINELIFGHVLPAGQGQGVGRQISVNSGIDIAVPAYTINMVCGSGMKSVMNGYTSILAGLHDVVITGGVENMSQAPHLLTDMRNGKKMGSTTVEDHMLKDALIDAFKGMHMGITAENIADKYNISREEQDAFAYESQKRAIAAVDSDVFKDEIVPVTTTIRRKEVVVDKDEYPNRTTNEEILSNLRTAFKKDGSVTAGNSSGLNDGASAVMLASEEALKAHNLKPLVKIKAVGQGGVDPDYMGLGPTVAIKNALEQANLSIDDLGLIELNEAFSAQSLGVIHELEEQLGADREKLMEITNVHGGAIALGHPLGASGNRIIVTLIHEMLRRDVQYGLASLCIGGGMGTAIILEKI